jgi:rhodanese-related sulfurtransferase
LQLQLNGHMIAFATNSPELTMNKTVSRDELQARLAANPELVLLEALPQKYYDDWHLPNARHFPHDQARQLAPRVVPDPAAEIVVYCASSTCQNSHIAAAVLQQIGYANVSVYAGGKQDWSEAGLATETGRAAATVAA